MVKILTKNVEHFPGIYYGRYTLIETENLFLFNKWANFDHETKKNLA